MTSCLYDRPPVFVLFFFSILLDGTDGSPVSTSNANTADEPERSTSTNSHADANNHAHALHCAVSIRFPLTP